MYWILKGIQDDQELTFQLLVTGMHLSHEFGMTARNIEADGFPIAEKIEMLLSSDSNVAIATSMGIAMMGFAKAYERLKPDMLVVLGDRFEIHAAVSAAVPFCLPVAHIHGGETTEGSMDELFRHAITKMSHLHFTTTEHYRQRVIQLGERPENVFNFGAPGIDNIYRLPFLSKEELARELGIPEEKGYGIVTYHPVTLEDDVSGHDIREVLYALDSVPDMFWVMTLPNADTHGRSIMQALKGFVDKNAHRAKLFASLGQIRYLSLLKHASVMVGNSSSGLLEAPSFCLPVVNIGARQTGRIRDKNVIDVPSCESGEITKALEKALSDTFRRSLKGLESSYGSGGTAEKIVSVLKTVNLSTLRKKRFCDSAVNM